ncbi:high mobility group box domain-containing protein [Mycena sp. CBHHK59/15]|nr:high mobility group box domain-containing protein [Mycena sp. CBHHK59/15]
MPSSSHRSSAQNDSRRIARPPNAFLFFRSKFAQDTKASRGSAFKMGSQQDMSRLAGQRWQEMDDAERRPYFEMAAQAKQQHKLAYPGYKYTPGPKGAKAAARKAGVRPPAPSPQRREEFTLTPDHYRSRARPSSSSVNRMPTLTSPIGPPWAPSDPSNLEASSSTHATKGKGKHVEPTYPRPPSWDRTPTQFGMPNVAGPQAFTGPMSSDMWGPAPGEIQNYSTDQYSEPAALEFNQQLQEDFGFFCPWDHDFSQPPPRFCPTNTWNATYPRN